MRGVGYAVGLQERRLLRGLRRLLDRPGPARGHRRRAAGRPCTPPPPRSARAWSPSSSRSAAPSWAWTRSSVYPEGHRASAPAARRRRPGRPTSPAARSRPPASGIRDQVLGLAQRQARPHRARPAAGSAATSSRPAPSSWPRWPRSSATRSSRRPCSGGTGRPTRIDPETGQGFAHVQYAFAAHRAVVDVDTDLGLVKVDRAGLHPGRGQGHEPARRWRARSTAAAPRASAWPSWRRSRSRDGRIANPSFTDYLIPTILDMPPMRIEVLEYPDPNAPYGLRGVGEPPDDLLRPGGRGGDPRGHRTRPAPAIPIRPEHITDTP